MGCPHVRQNWPSAGVLSEHFGQTIITCGVIGILEPALIICKQTCERKQVHQYLLEGSLLGRATAVRLKKPRPAGPFPEFCRIIPSSHGPGMDIERSGPAVSSQFSLPLNVEIQKSSVRQFLPARFPIAERLQCRKESLNG